MIEIKIVKDGREIYVLTWSEKDGAWTPSPNNIVPTIKTDQLGYVIARAIEYNRQADHSR